VIVVKTDCVLQEQVGRARPDMGTMGNVSSDSMVGRARPDIGRVDDARRTEPDLPR